MGTISVLFRVDGGRQLGLGHAQRCLSLATALRHLGPSCFFLTNDEPRLLERMAGAGFDARAWSGHPSWSVDELENTVEFAASRRCAVIVVDSPHARVAYLRQLRDAGFFVCAIDDCASEPFPCQLVVNGDVHAPQLSYQSSSGDTRFLLGPEYSMLGREFWETPRRPARDVVRNVLVTLGGSDPHDLMPTVLRILDEPPERFAVTAVAGPFFSGMVDVETAARQAARPVRLVRSPLSIHDLLLDCDLAVSGAGQTLYELACVGCPAVAVQMAPDQDLQLRAFAEAGCVRPIHSGDEDGLAAIGEAVRSLLASPRTRTSMARAGRRLVDGRGALRVAEAILAEARGGRFPERSAAPLGVTSAMVVRGDTV